MTQHVVVLSCMHCMKYTEYSEINMLNMKYVVFTFTHVIMIFISMLLYFACLLCDVLYDVLIK